MTAITIPEETLALLSKYTNFVIIGHIEPDGDCLGSQLALGRFLERLGKTVGLYSPGPFTRPEIAQWELSFRQSLNAGDLQADALVIVLDCSTLERIGDFAEIVADRDILVIDHHASGHPFGRYHCIFPSAPSVTYLIQRIIETLGYQPTREEAEFLLFGFCTDTGFFRHLDNSAAEAFEAVGRLVACGASPNAVFHAMYGGRELASRTHLGTCLKRARPCFHGKVLLTWETWEEKQTIGAENRDSDSLYQLLQGVSGVEAVIFLRGETAEQFSVGLRSNTWMEMGQLARKFGGGGHARAAGFLSDGPLEELKERVLDALEAQLNEKR